MSMRKVTSMTMFVSLIVLILNSVILYIVPEGRVAYWADWHFWGLTKGQWADQHITVGVLFLIAGFLHIYYNWKPIVAYMKNKAREVKVFTGPFNVGLILSIIFIVGTYYQVPPMSTILDISQSIKDAASQKYGEPPYGHAESSTLKFFANKMDMDLEKSLELLNAAGIKDVNGKTVIKELAKENDITPQQFYQILKPAAKKPASATGAGVSGAFPDAPIPGWAKKKFADFCNLYGLPVERMMHKLADKGISIEPDSSIKDNAEANEISPMEIFEAMQEIVKGTSS